MVVPDWSLVLAGVVAGLPAVVGVQVDRARHGFALVVAATALALFASDVAQLGIVIAVLTGLSLELPRPTAGRKAVVVPHRAVATYAAAAALLLAAADLPNDPGAALTVVAAVAMATAASVGWLGAHRLGPGFAWLLVAAGAVPVYAAVPDTEQITVVAVALGVASLVILARPTSAVPGAFTVAVAAAPGGVVGGCGLGRTPRRVRIGRRSPGWSRRRDVRLGCPWRLRLAIGAGGCAGGDHCRDLAGGGTYRRHRRRRRPRHRHGRCGHRRGRRSDVDRGAERCGDLSRLRSSRHSPPR